MITNNMVHTDMEVFCPVVSKAEDIKQILAPRFIKLCTESNTDLALILKLLWAYRWSKKKQPGFPLVK